MTGLPTLSASMTFDEACAAVVDYLKTALPMGSWAINRLVDERQFYLTISDDAYGKQAGDSHAWTDGFCQYMVSGEGPRIAPDAMSVPAYAGAPAASAMTVGSYIGMPISRTNGQLFGTLCGLDPEIKAAELKAQEPLLELLSSLLAMVLEADLARTEAAQAAERTSLEAETDALTGLYNRRGWDRYLALEEARYRRFGDPGSIIILDLDRLKEINDSRGHTAGDEYIQRAAKTLLGSVRTSDVVARLGGDEFGIVAARTPADHVDLLVSRLREDLENSGIAGSFGHAPYTITAGFPGAWEAADQAMYAEKSRRRADAVAAVEAALRLGRRSADTGTSEPDAALHDAAVDENGGRGQV